LLKLSFEAVGFFFPVCELVSDPGVLEAGRDVTMPKTSMQNGTLGDGRGGEASRGFSSPLRGQHSPRKGKNVQGRAG